MERIPQDTNLDSTFTLLREGYDFISKRCERYQTDVFATRLLLRKAICMRGADAARLFYDGNRFTRQGAMPPMTLRLLQDKGSVQTLDSTAHRQRKLMFMALLNSDAVEQLADAMDQEWAAQLRLWESQEQVVLFDEVRKILFQAVCRWAGLPLPVNQAEQKSQQFGAMIDGAGSIGPKMWAGMFKRTRAEKWVHGLIDEIRAGELNPPPESAASIIAWHRDLDGKLLPPAVAAIELINILRPTVAIGRFIVFAALALHQHPEQRPRLTNGFDDQLEHFVQEVRRFYPFFPVIAGRARRPLEWNGIELRQGQWVILDLYGTNHDPAIWHDPGQFRPERFQDWNEDAFNFIPQGGGNHYHSHRCPGERATIELMKHAVRQLVSHMDYTVPEQDLHIDKSQMPTLPQSRFVIQNVSRTTDTNLLQ